ncbi:uncharacterized protein G2W53_031981 [Senna tora]|uniref:Uncharacterized protein n=1 Tax=Senna tora TaxID=362788 RepID=A0A834SY00_9FABA|nr:uncharacterized protein G2W53_031981 [Senna tora]
MEWWPSVVPLIYDHHTKLIQDMMFL